MTRFKLLAATAIAASAIGVGGLAAAPSASAAPKYSCTVAYALAAALYASAEVFDAVGNSTNAAYYRGKADGIVDASC